MEVKVHGTSSEWTKRAHLAVQSYIWELGRDHSLIRPPKKHPRYERLFAWLLNRYARVMKKKREVMKIISDLFPS